MPRGFSPATYQGQGIQQADWSGPSAGQIIGQGLADFASSISQGVEESRAKSSKAKALRTTLSEYGLMEKGGGQDLSLAELEARVAAAPYLLQQQEQDKQSKAMSSAIAHMFGPDFGPVTKEVRMMNAVRQFGPQLSPENMAILLNYFGGSQRATTAAQQVSQARLDKIAEQRQKYQNPDLTDAQVDFAAGLQKEMAGSQAVKNHQLLRVAYAKIQGYATGEQTPAKDMGLIFNYMKMLDPGSTVREGEYATVEQARNISDNVRMLYNKAVDGVKLTESQRQKYLQASGTTLKASRDTTADIIGKSYGSRFKMAGIPASYIDQLTNDDLILGKRELDTVEIDGVRGVVPKSQDDIERAFEQGLPIRINEKWLDPKQQN